VRRLTVENAERARKCSMAGAEEKAGMDDTCLHLRAPDPEVKASDIGRLANHPELRGGLRDEKNYTFCLPFYYFDYWFCQGLDGYGSK